MAADHIAVPVDDRWGIETKGADRRHQLVKVLGSVLVRIARIDLQPVDRLVDDREPGGAGVRSISRVQDVVHHNKTPFDRARVLRSAGWRVAAADRAAEPGIGRQRNAGGASERGEAVEAGRPPSSAALTGKLELGLAATKNPPRARRAGRRGLGCAVQGRSAARRSTGIRVQSERRPPRAHRR